MDNEWLHEWRICIKQTRDPGRNGDSKSDGQSESDIDSNHLIKLGLWKDALGDNAVSDELKQTPLKMSSLSPKVSLLISFRQSPGMILF